jgi:hypothetical protein
MKAFQAFVNKMIVRYGDPEKMPREVQEDIQTRYDALLEKYNGGAGVGVSGKFNENQTSLPKEEFIEKAEKVSKYQVGRPDRERIIQQDEITNLKIALGEIDTIEEFIKSM